MCFYKSKYIIALYDNNDRNCGTYNNTNEFCKRFKNYNRENIISGLSKIFNNPNRSTLLGYNVFFIDVKQKYNDCFIEEDRIFLNKFNVLEK